MSRVTRTFAAYNSRRYGRPWIAKVTAWPIGKPPVLEFGCTVGLTAEVDAEPGAIVRWGQKDLRGHNTEACWGPVRPDLTVAETDAEGARDHWIAGCPAAAYTSINA